MPGHGQSPVRVLVLDDSEVFQNVLSAVVAATPGFEVVGTTSSGREALHLVDALGADLVLVDLHMSEPDSLETARRLRRLYPGVVVLLLTQAWRPALSDPSLLIEDKRELSADWLIRFWGRYGESRALD